MLGWKPHCTNLAKQELLDTACLCSTKPISYQQTLCGPHPLTVSWSSTICICGTWLMQSPPRSPALIGIRNSLKYMLRLKVTSSLSALSIQVHQGLTTSLNSCPSRTRAALDFKTYKRMDFQPSHRRIFYPIIDWCHPSDCFSVFIFDWFNKNWRRCEYSLAVRPYKWALSQFLLSHQGYRGSAVSTWLQLDFTKCLLSCQGH